MTNNNKAGNSESRITALYVRVSTGYQIDKDSLPFQKKELKNYCLHVLHIPNEEIEIYEDAGKSGKNTDRPAFQRMMKKVKAGKVARVVVYKIDRISRNLVDFSLMYDDFKDNRTTFISLNEQFDTSSAIGEAVLKIILVFAELERKLTSERVTGVMIGRAQDAKWNGARVPFGWAWDEKEQKPVHDPIEADIVRKMFSLYEETRSSSKIRDYLNENGIATKRGGEWTTKTVGDILHNPINRGDYRYNYRHSARGKKKPEEEVVYIKGVFPALIDPEQFDRVQIMIEENRVKMQGAGFSHKKIYTHVFAGLLVCADCGNFFQARNADRTRANGFRPSIYFCSGKNKRIHCAARGASDVIVGAFVFSFVQNLVGISKRRREVVAGGLDSVERALLSGDPFNDVSRIDAGSLRQIFDALRGVSRSAASYIPAPLPKENGVVGNVEKKRSEAAKIARALERLKKAYLFDDDVMDEREYITTRAKLEEDLTRINNEIAEAEEETFDDVSELSFVHSASEFLLSYQIQSDDPIVYSDFAPIVGNDTLKNFVNMIIDRIEIKNRNVTSITFKNGLEARFIYKDMI